MRKRISHTL